MTDDADDTCLNCGVDVDSDDPVTRPDGTGPFCSPSCSTFYWMDGADSDDRGGGA